MKIGGYNWMSPQNSSSISIQTAFIRKHDFGNFIQKKH